MSVRVTKVRGSGGNEWIDISQEVFHRTTGRKIRDHYMSLHKKEALELYREMGKVIDLLGWGDG